MANSWAGETASCPTFSSSDGWCGNPSGGSQGRCLQRRRGALTAGFLPPRLMPCGAHRMGAPLAETSHPDLDSSQAVSESPSAGIALQWFLTRRPRRGAKDAQRAAIAAGWQWASLPPSGAALFLSFPSVWVLRGACRDDHAPPGPADCGFELGDHLVRLFLGNEVTHVREKAGVGGVFREG